MANTIGGLQLSPRRILLVVACAVPIVLASVFVLNRTEPVRSDGSGVSSVSDVSEECVQDSAEIAEAQAAAIEELGPDAPVTGFWFPESCFE